VPSWLYEPISAYMVGMLGCGGNQCLPTRLMAGNPDDGGRLKRSLCGFSSAPFKLANSDLLPGNSRICPRKGFFFLNDS